jgi:hypothetical protein
LVGYRKIESNSDIPPNYSTLKDDDPYPITVFGLSKPISSNKINNYLTTEFYHYLQIYKNTKSFGLPYDNWFDAPHWLLDLIDKFDTINDEYKLLKGLL